MSIQYFSDSGGEMLSQFFSLKEMTTTSYPIANNPTPEHKQNLTVLAQALDVLRNLVGPIAIDSGYRSTELQTYIRTQGTAAEQAQAAARSFHEQGLAADIQPLQVSAAKLWSMIAADSNLLAMFGEIALKDTVIHISLPTNGAVGGLVIDPGTPQKQSWLMQVLNNEYIRLSMDSINRIIQDSLGSAYQVASDAASATADEITSLADAGEEAVGGALNWNILLGIIGIGALLVLLSQRNK